MYSKRNIIANFWPVPRKGTKYLATASHEKTNSIPLLIVMREILNLVRKKKELKTALNESKILINEKIIKDIHYPLLLFDVLSIPSMKKNYRLILKNKKFYFEEEKEAHSKSRVYKIIGKKKIKKGIIQINLNNGKNLFSGKENFTMGDFVVLDNSTGKIIKKISLGKGTKVLVVSGKHMSTYGEVESLREESNKKVAEVRTSNKEKIIIELNNLFALE